MESDHVFSLFSPVSSLPACLPPHPRPRGGQSLPRPSVQLTPHVLFSCAHSRSPLLPPTPDSYFSSGPAIITPDDFPFQIDVQLDEIVAQPSPKTDPSFLSGDDTSKLQVFLRNKGRWGNMYDRLESSPPLRPHNPVSPLSQDSASDEFSWETAHSALVDPNQLLDPSRCSLLIHEVSLLVGLTADDDLLALDDGDSCPLVPDVSKQVHDILPLSLTPTKSLASRKHRNVGLTQPTNPNVPVHSPDIPIYPRTENAVPSLYNKGHPLVGSRNPATPIPRHKSADAPSPTQSPRRRQGKVFFEPPFNNPPRRDPVDLDRMFSCPRPPPPKPPPNSPVNRCSSLDRLERSLLKLEAHAPRNHRKSQSEGRPSDRVIQRKDKRPSLPPPRHLRQQQSSHETMHRNAARPAHDFHCTDRPPPVPRPIPPYQCVAPRIPLHDDPLEEDLTPGSFMDMDIPHTEEARLKRQTSFRRGKMKSLVGVAKRVSQGVITWGKHLTGSTKPSVAARGIAII